MGSCWLGLRRRSDQRHGLGVGGRGAPWTPPRGRGGTFGKRWGAREDRAGRGTRPRKPMVGRAIVPHFPRLCFPVNTRLPDRRTELEEWIGKHDTHCFPKSVHSRDPADAHALGRPDVPSLAALTASRPRAPCTALCGVRTQKSQTLKSVMVLSPWGSLHLHLCIFSL